VGLKTEKKVQMLFAFAREQNKFVFQPRLDIQITMGDSFFITHTTNENKNLVGYKKPVKETINVIVL
jgi:hypothetical protein